MQENGTNVYRLSNSSSLERTTLQRMVTGKRLPGIDFVKQFCKELRMSAAEEQQLMELYHIEQIGEDVYQNRMIIRNLLRYLANLEKLCAYGLRRSSPARLRLSTHCTSWHLLQY